MLNNFGFSEGYKTDGLFTLGKIMLRMLFMLFYASFFYIYSRYMTFKSYI
jgi:hypothetical protein